MSADTKEPLVSIITPTYNHERYIGNCINSVLEQSYPHWEQIILDDQSTDRTNDVVRSFRDPRLIYIRQQHKGIAGLTDTYNHALSISKGSLIAILEGDDAWPANKLAQQVPIFANTGIIFAYGEVRNIDADGNPARRTARTARRRPTLPKSILMNDPVGSTTAYLLSAPGQSLVEPSTVVMRRSALEEIGGFQYFPGGCPTDIPTFTRLSRVGYFHYSPMILGYRRRHIGSATQQFLGPMWQSSREFVLGCLDRGELELSASDREEIERSWDPRSPGREFAAGRICALEGQWRDARLHFRHALNIRNPRPAFASALGWTLTWFHTDLEGVFRLAGRTAFKRGVQVAIPNPVTHD